MSLEGDLIIFGYIKITVEISVQLVVVCSVMSSPVLSAEMQNDSERQSRDGAV